MDKMENVKLPTRDNRTESIHLDVPGHTLKVATRVQIPLGLLRIFQFRGQIWPQMPSGYSGRRSFGGRALNASELHELAERLARDLPDPLDEICPTDTAPQVHVPRGADHNCERNPSLVVIDESDEVGRHRCTFTRLSLGYPVAPCRLGEASSQPLSTFDCG